MIMDHKQILKDLSELDSDGLKQVADYIGELKGSVKIVKVWINSCNGIRPVINDKFILTDSGAISFYNEDREDIEDIKLIKITDWQIPRNHIPWIIITEDNIVYTGGGSYYTRQLYEENMRFVIKVESGSYTPLTIDEFKEEIKEKEIYS